MTTAGAGAVRRPVTPAQRERKRMARINRIMVRVVLAVVVVGIFLYIGGLTQISAGAKRISALRAQIAAEESRQQQLEIALVERQNLDMIRSEAVSRLGLSLPGTWSVQVVSLPAEYGAGDAQAVYDATGE